MPITVSNMAAIQAMLNSQKAAIDVTVNAARDNVNANVDADAATLAGVVNAARDNVKADTTAQLATQTTAINNNTDTKTSAVTTAVNAKGVIKSVQRINWGSAASTVTIAAVVPAKTIIVLDAIVQQGGTGTSAYATIANATTVNVGASVSMSAQVVEYF